MIDAKTSFSIVIPCFHSENSLPELVERIDTLFSKENYLYEIILINDGSTDNTWQVIQQLHQQNRNITGINLTRNFGQQSAVLCGLEQAKNEIVVTLDDDLQHRPEDIFVLFNYLREKDLDLVIASFESKEHGGIRNLGTRMVQSVSNIILGTPRNFKFSSFRVMRHDVAKNALRFSVANPVVGYLLIKTTNKVANFELEHAPRKFGQSNYNFKRLVDFFLTMLFDYSMLPLQVMGYFGALISFMSFGLGGYYFIRWWLGYIQVSGFTTFVLLICFFFGLLFISLGIIGAYFIRVLQNTNSHPLYLVKEKITTNE